MKRRKKSQAGSVPRTKKKPGQSPWFPQLPQNLRRPRRNQQPPSPKRRRLRRRKRPRRKLLRRKLLQRKQFQRRKPSLRRKRLPRRRRPRSRRRKLPRRKLLQKRKRPRKRDVSASCRRTG